MCIKEFVVVKLCKKIFNIAQYELSQNIFQKKYILAFKSVLKKEKKNHRVPK